MGDRSGHLRLPLGLTLCAGPRQLHPLGSELVHLSVDVDARTFLVLPLHVFKLLQGALVGARSHGGGGHRELLYHGSLLGHGLPRRRLTHFDLRLGGLRGEAVRGNTGRVVLVPDALF